MSANLIEAGTDRTQELAAALSGQEDANRQRSIPASMFQSITLTPSAARFEVNVARVAGLLMQNRDATTDAADRIPDLGGIPGPEDSDRAAQPSDDGNLVVIEHPIMLRRRGNGMRIVIDLPYAQPEPDPSLIDLVARAHVYLTKLTGPSAMNTGAIARPAVSIAPMSDASFPSPSSDQRCSMPS